jgi:cytoskeleton protein RodZ
VAEFGDRLREARESKGLSLEQAEQFTRIRHDFLKALEETRLDALPGHAYARGFVRNYARLLDLDPEEMVAAYRKAAGVPAEKTPEILDEPLLRARPNIWAGLFVAVMALLVVFTGGWYAYNRLWLGQQPEIPWQPWQQISPVQPTTAFFFVTPSPTPTSTPSPQVIAEVTSSTEVKEPTPTETVVEAVPTATETPWPTAVVRQRTPTPTSTVSPTSAPVEFEGLVVESRVTAATYVLVTVDGERVMEKVLQPGEDPVWQGRESVALRVGNAGGIRLILNGVEMPSLGSSGQVVNVEYTLDDLPES